MERDTPRSHLAYRPDIDGLRAIAVVAVVWFHVFPQRLRSGFIGVDVFFVISGFLISTIIFSSLERGTFSIIGFYNRRIRRIFPALLAILATLLVIGYFTFLADEYGRLGKHVAGGAGFVSNFVLRGESGYFDAAAETKPLLHLWSLGIEEQFYIFWPLLLAFVRRRDWSFLPITIVIAGASFALNLYFLGARPAAAFYWPFTRFWELMIGGILAYLSLERPDLLKKHGGVRAWIGAALLGTALLVINKSRPFPGWWALLPTVGTFLLISAGPNAWLNRKLLSFKPLVWIGLISYPLYLWHWVLLATIRILGSHVHGASIMVIGGAFALSVLTYFVIEKPLRRSPSNVVPVALVISMCLVGLAGWSVYKAGGLEGYGYRSPEKTAFARQFDNSLPDWSYFERERILEKFNTRCDFYDLNAYRDGNETTVPLESIAKECYVRDPAYGRSVFIWGDSHAQQFYFGLKNQLPHDWQILQVAASGCAASLKAENPERDFCDRSNWFALKSIAETKPDVVLVGQNRDHDLHTMAELAKKLHAIGAKTVIFTGPTPHWTQDLPKLVMRKLWKNTPQRTFVGVDDSVVANDAALKRSFEQTSDTRYVSVMDYFCTRDGCLVYVGDDLQSGLTTWDYGHLTPAASNAFAKDVLAPLIVGGGK